MPLQFIWTDYPEKYDDDALLKKIDFEPVLPVQNAASKGGVLKNHLFIEGDNYPVLKKLAEMKHFAGKINLIYIDPPYNTGNDFTYNDDFSSDGDSHSRWLSFMQRRLAAARTLLSEKGCIFVAIDQNELYTLKLLCNQIFGEENFVNDFMWLHGKGKKDTWSRTLQQHTLCYARNKRRLPAFREVEETNWATKNVDNDPRGNWFSGSISFTEARSNPRHKNYYSITSPSGKVWIRQWLTDEARMKELIADNRIFWGDAPGYDKVPRVKIFNEDSTEVIPRNIIDCTESTRAAQRHLDDLLGVKGAFDNPKPVSLIKHLIQITRQPVDALILDFFAGSGTTFEAVCELNRQEGTSRRCILVQKKEPVQKTAGSFKYISDICIARCEKVRTTFDTPDKISFHQLRPY